MLTIHHGLVSHSFHWCVILEGYPATLAANPLIFRRRHPKNANKQQASENKS